MIARWTKTAARWCLDNHQAILPALVAIAFVHGLVFFQYPGNFCDLDESVEPLQTLKYVHGKGQVPHKWGPVPHLLYAPLYAPWLGYWWLGGQLGKINLDYPYGFTRPFEQQGTLIVMARLAGLVVGGLAIVAYGWSLRKLTMSRGAVLLALLLCVATSPDLTYKFVATKPDGLMNAFLMLAMACYALVLAEGLTWRRGAWMSLFAVLSISCKEQTAPAFILPYLGLAIDGWRRADARGRFVRDFAATVGIGVLAYLLINVVTAPSAYREHVAIWLGAGKDPAVWAGSNQDLGLYLWATFDGLLFNFGPGALGAVGAALLASLVVPFPRRLMLWLPSLSYFAIVVAMAGYMPNYFMTPLNILVAAPLAALLAHLGGWLARVSWPGKVLAGAAVVALVAFNAWVGNLAWARARLITSEVEERYCLRAAGRDELVHTGNLMPRQPGASRLTYLGFRVDDRPLGEIMARPADMPDLVLISREYDSWLKDFKNRPGREAAFKEWSGRSHAHYDGFEALGYRLDAVARPTLPGWLNVPWVRWSWGPLAARSEVLVYRRDAEREE